MEESNDCDVSPCPGASPEVNKTKVTTNAVKGVGVRKARQRRREIIKTIQEHEKQLFNFGTEEEILVFERHELTNLDWEVCDFLKTVNELEETVGQLDLEGRIASEFESLVGHCKDRAKNLVDSRESDFTPTNIQLGKSSRSGGSRRSRISRASEIIQEELELAQLDAEFEAAEIKAWVEREMEAERARMEANAKVEIEKAARNAEIAKKKAQIEAKICKQQSMGSDCSGQSSRMSSRSSKFSTFRSPLGEGERPVQANGPMDQEVGGDLFMVGKPGLFPGAAQEKQRDSVGLRWMLLMGPLNCKKYIKVLLLLATFLLNHLRLLKLAKVLLC